MTSENESGDIERLQALEQRMDQLDSTVRTLATTVARLVNADLTPDDGGRESADAVPSVELVRWVHWLVIRYELSHIPECWAQHGAFVEELDALRIAWLESVGRGEGAAAIQWHDLADRTLDRLRSRARACAGGTQHRPPEPPVWATEPPAEVAQPDLDDRYEPSPEATETDPDEGGSI